MALLMGYGDRLTVAPGEQVTVMVSAERHYEAQVVQLLHGDDDPGGPGFRERELASEANGKYRARVQGTLPGSYVRVDLDGRPIVGDGLTLCTWVYPTTPVGHGLQGLLSLSASLDCMAGLFIGDDGRPTLCTPGGNVALPAEEALRPREWYFVAATIEFGSGTVRVFQWSSAGTGRQPSSVAGRMQTSAEQLAPERLLLGAASEERARCLFNGKLDRPAVIAAPLPHAALARIAGGADLLEFTGEALHAAWDLGREVHTDLVVDRGGHGLHGQAINMPMRAVTGYNWLGRELHFERAPEQYGAMHFHADDLADAAWEPSMVVDVPAETPSGVYAVRLLAGNDREHVPFIVRPRSYRPAEPRALVLLPTLTYMAYGNERCLAPEHQPARPPGWVVPAELLDAVLERHPELGMSLYDTHGDGTGCCYSSRLRPLLNMRPTYRSRLVDAGRHFCADLYLIDWLEQCEHPFDVITDEDLHRDGEAALVGYPAVITGSHPEYVTEQILEALSGYLDHGGNLMYLGGNGFYWVTSIGGRSNHVIEVRRGYSGTRNWTSAPGECHHSTTGEPGGLWRHRGRPPNRLVGVGFGALGQDPEAKGYRRLADSFKPEAEFIFRGVGRDEVIGDFGLVMGGAAGDEMDRIDEVLGVPPGLLHLATAEGFSDYYQVAIEDEQQMTPQTGGATDPRIRADLTYFERPEGGSVFSVGSMCWTGSLSHAGYDNNVSRITGNVLVDLFGRTPPARRSTRESGPHGVDRRG